MDSMDTMDETHDAPAQGSSVEAYQPRGYQLEMLEASLQQNIIVAVGQPPLVTSCPMLIGSC